MKLDYKEVKNHTDCMCDELCGAICATCSILVFLCYSVIALHIKLNPPTHPFQAGCSRWDQQLFLAVFSTLL